MDAHIAVKLVETLVWPVTCLIIVLQFKGQIAGLFKRISTVEAAGIRADFGAELSKVRAIQDRSGESEKPTAFNSQALHLLRLADLSPNGAVVDAWREVELAVISAALHAEVDVRGGKGRVSGNAAMKKLQEKGLISESTLAMFSELRELRNKAAHSPQAIEPEDAKEYTLAAVELAAKFRECRDGPL